MDIFHKHNIGPVSQTQERIYGLIQFRENSKTGKINQLC